MTQKIAIVTGAARGIGAGTAIRLASDGMAVAVLDLTGWPPSSASRPSW